MTMTKWCQNALKVHAILKGIDRNLRDYPTLVKHLEMCAKDCLDDDVKQQVLALQDTTGVSARDVGYRVVIQRLLELLHRVRDVEASSLGGEPEVGSAVVGVAEEMGVAEAEGVAVARPLACASPAPPLPPPSPPPPGTVARLEPKRRRGQFATPASAHVPTPTTPTASGGATPGGTSRPRTGQIDTAATVADPYASPRTRTPSPPATGAGSGDDGLTVTRYGEDDDADTQTEEEARTADPPLSTMSKRVRGGGSGGSGGGGSGHKKRKHGPEALTALPCPNGATASGGGTPAGAAAPRVDQADTSEANVFDSPERDIGHEVGAAATGVDDNDEEDLDVGTVLDGFTMARNLVPNEWDAMQNNAEV